MDYRVTVKTKAGKPAGHFRIRLPKDAPHEHLRAEADRGLAVRVRTGALPLDSEIAEIKEIAVPADPSKK